MTKTELKSIIKECLLEILADGLGDSLNEVANRKKTEKMIVEKKEQERRMIQRKREISESISVATSDPVLQKVLSHTAETTLKEQLQHDSKKMPSSYSDDDQLGSGDPGLDISKIFGGSTKNWAAVAFSDKKRLG
jgi:hypothetical protein